MSILFQIITIKNHKQTGIQTYANPRPVSSTSTGKLNDFDLSNFVYNRKLKNPQMFKRYTLNYQCICKIFYISSLFYDNIQTCIFFINKQNIICNYKTNTFQNLTRCYASRPSHLFLAFIIGCRKVLSVEIPKANYITSLSCVLLSPELMYTIYGTVQRLTLQSPSTILMWINLTPKRILVKRICEWCAYMYIYIYIWMYKCLLCL